LRTPTLSLFWIHYQSGGRKLMQFSQTRPGKNSSAECF
jgi:hypothetical protein